MSFTFRDLFSDDDTETPSKQGRGDPSEKRGGMPLNSGRSGEVQCFLVSELLPFIPPAISAQSGIPMEKEVAVPIPADESRDIELSSLYQICPELFATEITPLNDSVITLPMRLGSIEDSPAAAPSFAASTAPAASSPPRPSEAMSSPKEDSFAEEKGGNPFSSAPAASSPPKQVVTGARGFGNGFQGASLGTVGEEEGEPFGFSPGVSHPEKQGDEKASGPVADHTSGDSFHDQEEPVFGFGSSLMGVTTNPFDSSEGFATLFSKQARADENIPFPGAFSIPEAEETGVPKPEESSGSREAASMKEEAGASPEDDTPQAGFSAPTGFSSSPAFESHHFPGMSPDDPAAGNSLGKEETRDGENVAGSVEKAPLADLFPAAPQNPLPQPVEAVPEDEAPDESNDSKESPAARKIMSIQASVAPPRPVEESPTAREAEVEHSTTELPRGGEEDLLRDLEFRAIFSLSEPFTLSKVARSVVGLPGINGCALATPGKIVQASKGEEGRLGEEAREMVDSIRNLARLSGMPEAKSFTLHTDRGTVSLLLERECCVTVHHEGEAFAPGVQEKLILIARSIHKLGE